MNRFTTFFGARTRARRFAVELDYPIHPRARFGHGAPVHPELEAIISKNRAIYVDHVHRILDLRGDLVKIARSEPKAPGDPIWINGWIPGLDSAALYSFLVHNDPATYIEVGSGNSTKFARRAIRDHGLRTRLISIDPQPRAEIDALCDEVIRRPLEDADLSVFDGLVSGDIVFIDNSHRVFQNSDVVVVFLEVVPRLRSGVLVEIHDIFLPEDYPPEWTDRYYSEQYMLAAFLLGGDRAFTTEFPCHYVTHEPELSSVLEPLWTAPEMEGVERHGGSYWVRISGR